MGHIVDSLTKYHLLYWVIKLVVHMAVTGAALALLYFMVSRMNAGAREFWVGVFSDSGTPSWSRVASGLIVLLGVIWVSFLVFVNHALPDMSGLALLIGVPYGLNVVGKAGTMIGTAMSGKNAPPAPQP
jgi:hypothetical protein